MRRALIFQHFDDDGPGRIGERLAADGVTTETIQLHRSGVIPSLQPYDLLLVLGGTQQVWQEREHPWLIAEKQAIREWVVERGRPYIGICFGHQLLADALGGQVGLASEPEVGVGMVEILPAADHPFLAGLTGERHAMQWHAAEVKRLPPDAQPLATSAVSPIQAMAVDNHALGLQFHFEWTLPMIRRWAELPNWLGALERALGPGAHPKLVAQCAPLMPDIVAMTDRIYDNFRRVAC